MPHRPAAPLPAALAPDFDDKKRVDSHVVIALSAARSALNIAAGGENPADEPDR
jgi:hypothetical protein